MRVLVINYVALLLLLALTVWVSYLPLGHWNLVLALAIAAAKMLLIMGWFMHLRGAPGWLKTMALAGFVWLALLLVLSLDDVLLRG